MNNDPIPTTTFQQITSVDMQSGQEEVTDMMTDLRQREIQTIQGENICNINNHLIWGEVDGEYVPQVIIYLPKDSALTGKHLPGNIGRSR